MLKPETRDKNSKVCHKGTALSTVGGICHKKEEIVYNKWCFCYPNPGPSNKSRQTYNIAAIAWDAGGGDESARFGFTEGGWVFVIPAGTSLESWNPKGILHMLAPVEIWIPTPYAQFELIVG